MKKILMLLALAGLSSAAMAQQKTEVVEYEIIQVQDKYQVITNPFWSNWFFSIGGGAEATFGDNDSAGSFGKRISPTLNISVGKWFTPGLGLRLQYSGLQARGFTYDKGADYVKGAELKDGYYKQRFDYMNLHGDVMFNLNALFGGYNQHRVYEIIPYVGAGFTHNYSKPHREALSVNAGIINKFRISNAVDINLELSAMAAEDKFDGEVGGDHGYDGVLSATVGLTYRFPARGFRRPMPQLISQIELAAMQDKLAMMGAQNAELKNALIQAENQPVAEVTETNKMIENYNLDVRTITLGISLLDCISDDLETLNNNIYNKIKRLASNLVQTGEDISKEYGIPIVNKRISVTPIALIGGSACKKPEDFVTIAKTLDKVAKEVGVNFLGGYSALVNKGMTPAEENLIRSIPEALAVTERVCSSVNVGSSKTGINMDAVRLMGEIVHKTAEKTANQDSLGCAKLVVFCNAPDDNPFMAGAFHGVTEADAIINVGVSGPGVVRHALKKVRGENFEVLCDTIKNTANRKTGSAEPRITAKELQTSNFEPSRTAFFMPRGMAIR